MYYGHIRKKKRFLPRSILGRSLIILVTPLLLVQLITNFVFTDRYVDSVTKLLAKDIVGVVNTLVYLQNKVPADNDSVSMIVRTFDMGYNFMPDVSITDRRDPPSSWAESYLLDELNQHLQYPYTLRHDGEYLVLKVGSKNGLIALRFLRKRLWTKTTKLVFIWAIGATVLFLLIAACFMRSQLKPLEDLAAAADAFGKGDGVLTFTPRGASEIRQVGQAFGRMQSRIKRFIDQRTEMLAGISHDLRTPLTRMKLALEIFPQDVVTQGLREDVRDMQHMIEAYLDFVRQNDMEAVMQTNLYDLLEKIVARFYKNGFLVALDLPARVYAGIRPQTFTRCIVNLLENARQYANHVCIRCEQENGRVLLYIDDDGPGIPTEERANALKAFYRLDASRSQNKTGVGLGLSIVQDIMHRQGGDVFLDTSPEGGLRVILKLLA